MSNGTRPRHFDRNLVVLGAGSAGLVSAYIAAAVRARVTLIERDKMGGDCLNTGCVPSKAFIRSARFLAHVRRARDFGFKSAAADFEFRDIMQRVREIIQKIAPHDSVERYTRLGVECLQGEARLLSPWTVAVNGQTLSARSLIIASGARPFIPPIRGIEQINCLTSDNVWYIDELPARLVVLGGGPIGCELAQAFARFGSKVTQVEMLPSLLVREDEDVAAYMTRRFGEEGINVRVNHRASEVRVNGSEKFLVCEHDGNQVEIPFDELLVAVGRQANSTGFGLEDIGVELTGQGTIRVNNCLQSSIDNIYACGDVAGPYQFTHTAAHQAWYAAVNALFGGLKKFRVDYSVIPWATFTDPEIARVGLNEKQARDKNIDHEVTIYGIDDLDRAITESEAHGFIKVVTKKGKDEILGVTIVADHAGEMIAEYIGAMKQGVGLNRILGTIHIYPTMSEANKYVAGAWKKNHAPQLLLKLIGKYHDWMRK